LTKEWEETVDRKLAEKLATEYVRIHNAAAKEFKPKFKEVGARMWHFDNAHILKRVNRDFIRDEILKRTDIPDFIWNIYHSPVDRPLTMLDSYPQVTKEQRDWLDRQVDEITSRHNTAWRQFLRQELRKAGLE
jgi:hypothetical protein